MKRGMTGVVVVVLSVLASGAAHAACSAQGTGVVLTVSGAVAEPNRGAFDEKVDVFHKLRGNKWEKAREFSVDALKALPQKEVVGYMAYDAAFLPYQGPALADVLKAAGAAGTAAVSVQALDGYEVEVTPDVLAADQPIVALCRDGKPLPIGGLGPLVVVVPTQGGVPPSEDQGARQVWGLFHIGVK